MKTVTFRPLRRVKKTGKIAVASYPQWRKVRTADYSKFNLIINDEYKGMPADEFVFNHEGEQLFFYTYNPDEVPMFVYPFEMELADIFIAYPNYCLNWGEGRLSYKAKGVDCDGVPTFSHYTANDIGAHYKDVNAFEPLTVGMVTKWFGWFLYQLENSYLQIGKTSPSK